MGDIVFFHFVETMAKSNDHEEGHAFKVTETADPARVAAFREAQAAAVRESSRRRDAPPKASR